jgi:hypothetical protein
LEDPKVPGRSSEVSISQAVAAILTAGVIALGGLFIQVAKLDQSVTNILTTVEELRNDTKDRITNLEGRVRVLEIHGAK